MNRELRIFGIIAGVFTLAYFLPLSNPTVTNAILEAFRMLQWYARNHTLACVVPAMFIAGAIAAFLSKEAVLRHLGPKANRVKAYGVASVAGVILAVCSCSVLPMFAGIYQVGAGLGPASAFLYSGPAINVMAIFLTARVLGWDLGVARLVVSIAFAVVIGLSMQLIFRAEDRRRTDAMMEMEPMPSSRSLWQTGAFLVAMIAFLVFSDWASPSQTVIRMSDGREMHAVVMLETTSTYRLQLEEPSAGQPRGARLDVAKDEIVSKTEWVPEQYEWAAWIHRNRWYLAGLCLVAVLVMTWRWFDQDERREWMDQTWSFAKMIVPLLFGGVFVTGFIGALIPEGVVASWVGGNSLSANLVASLIGSLWYFATLTEIPILEALMGQGMGKGPALSLLLAGPALSLPSIAVIYSILGFKKTLTFILLVIVLSTIAGMAFGVL